MSALFYRSPAENLEQTALLRPDYIVREYSGKVLDMIFFCVSQATVCQEAQHRKHFIGAAEPSIAHFPQLGAGCKEPFIIMQIQIKQIDPSPYGGAKQSNGTIHTLLHSIPTIL